MPRQISIDSPAKVSGLEGLEYCDSGAADNASSECFIAGHSCFETNIRTRGWRTEGRKPRHISMVLLLSLGPCEWKCDISPRVYQSIRIPRCAEVKG